MRADPEEYVAPAPKGSGFPLVELALAAAVLAGILIFWFWVGEQPPQEMAPSAPAVVAVPIPQPELPPTPDIPQRTAPVAAVVPDTAEVVSDNGTIVTPTAPAPVAPLTPEEGDALLRKQLEEVGADAHLKKLVSNEHPLDVSAALIDGMSRGYILSKILPSGPPAQAFSIAKEGDVVTMSAASYQRYDGYADAIASLDSDAVVASFHTLRPLYEKAYEQLGLDPGDFDNAVIRTLDQVLATPEIDGPIPLKQKSLVYTYADPGLESLPAVQKQLLRMGPDNIRRIKQQAQAIRNSLLTQ